MPARQGSHIQRLSPDDLARITRSLDREAKAWDPTPRRPTQRRTEWRPGLKLALASVVAGSASFFTVLYADLAWWLITTFTVQTAAIGLVSALAIYIYALPEGAPISGRTALRRAVVGSVFGWIAAKTGVGFGLNESLQQASAGIGGAKGPEYMDKILDRLMGPRE